jgi:putative transposase
MPWKTNGLVGARMGFVLEAIRARQTMKQLCQKYGISRQVGYKWVKRFKARGRRGLRDQKRRPLESPGRLSPLWQGRIRQARRRRRHWGAKKIGAILRREHGAAHAPSERTIGRWLQRWKLTEPRRKRRRWGVTVWRAPLTEPRRVHQVWTADFKGWSLTLKGQKVQPLTVRDLYSRFALTIKALPSQSWRLVQREMRRLFQRHGLPQVIRVDNGHPFGSSGPAGLSRLSAWWTGLGIRAEHIAPGHPEQNGSHEQFHAELKAEAMQPPPTTLRAAQRRLRRWQQRYNQDRPHQSLGMQTPASRYRQSRRKWKKAITVVYPKTWAQRQVRRHGEIKWQGRLRFIGEALIGQRVALEPIQPDQTNVYFTNVLLGQLHAADAGGLRPAAYVRPASARPAPDAKVSTMSGPKV